MLASTGKLTRLNSLPRCMLPTQHNKLQVLTRQEWLHAGNHSHNKKASDVATYDPKERRTVYWPKPIHKWRVSCTRNVAHTNTHIMHSCNACNASQMKWSSGVYIRTCSIHACIGHYSTAYIQLCITTYIIFFMSGAPITKTDKPHTYSRSGQSSTTVYTHTEITHTNAHIMHTHTVNYAVSHTHWHNKCVCRLNSCT